MPKLPHNYQDLAGKTFGRLTALSRVGVDSGGHVLWLCRTELGGEVVRNESYIKSLVRRREPEREVWKSMLGRCRRHREYGGRGIKVCAEWEASFEVFLRDMGPRPGKGWSLDRIDVDGDYEPGNCRWANDKRQARNKRGTVKITYKGETLSVPDWSDRLGISRSVIYRRLRAGLPVEDILSSEVRTWRRGKVPRGGSRARRAWRAMLARCENQKHPSWYTLLRLTFRACSILVAHRQLLGKYPRELSTRSRLRPSGHSPMSSRKLSKLFHLSHTPIPLPP